MIKYRIWDDELKKYYEPDYRAYMGKLHELLLTECGELVERSIAGGFRHESLFPNRYITEQYAGLKDKNGEEIYEGDILDIGSGYGKYNHVPVTIEPDGVHFGGYPFWANPIFCDHVIIAGNIHETAELLEVK